MNRKQYEKMKAKLREIELRNGGVLTPEAIVQEAAKKNSVLHAMFEWDDAKAAHQHRLDQARELIARVRYSFVYEERTYSAPAYVRDPNKESREQGYVSVARIRTDDDLRREALCDEFARCAAHLARAYELAKALDIDAEEVESIRRRVGVIQQSIASATIRAD